jgi:hypothetical protein
MPTVNAVQRFFLTGRIPLWVKVLYTAFVAVLVPVYLRDYGPTNFLYFCDVALLMTVVAIWWENSLLASAPLVGILVPQLLWMADFFAIAAGWPLINMTAYMFNQENPLFLRGLSFFHFWLPWLLVYMVWKLGYDRRAWLTWAAIGSILLLVCYFLMPEPPPPVNDPNLPVNINYVWGLKDDKPQPWMDGRLWFCMEFFGMNLAVWLPTHWALKKMFRPPEKQPIPA